MSRHVSAALAAGVAIAVAAMSPIGSLSAQDGPPAERQPPNEVSSEYIARLAADTPSREPGMIPYFNKWMEIGCARAGKMELSGLRDWETEINDALEQQLEGLVVAHAAWKELTAAGDGQAAAKARRKYASESQFTATKLYLNERMLECIRKREAHLHLVSVGEAGEGDRRLQATWSVGKCTESPDIQVDRQGGLAMFLRSDGSADGTFYSFEGAGELELVGTHRTGGHFEAQVPAGRKSIFVTLTGSVAQATPGGQTASGSGTLRIKVTWGDSYAECYGTWSSN